jgi:hypothetical protein
LISGAQVGSAWVSSLPSRPASRMAVIGRQNRYCALPFHVLMSASAPAV